MDLVRKKAQNQALVLQGGNAHGAGASKSASNSGPTKDDDVDDLELWPLIKSVKVKCNARALETGQLMSIQSPSRTVIDCLFSSKVPSSVIYPEPLTPTLLEMSSQRIISRTATVFGFWHLSPGRLE